MCISLLQTFSNLLFFMQNPLFFLSNQATSKISEFKEKSQIALATTKAGRSTPDHKAMRSFFNKNTRQSKENITINHKTSKPFFSAKRKTIKQRYNYKDRTHLKTAQNYHSRGSLGLFETIDHMTEEKREEINCRVFFSKVQSLEGEFVEYCREQNFDSAVQSKNIFIKVIEKLLNYSVDYNLKFCFLQALKKLSQFYLLISRYNEALFYFSQAKECSILLDEPVFLIQSIIGMAECCSKKLFNSEAVLILKKGLQYTWFYNLPQYELTIYDHIGKQLYLMGQTDKASKYHSRYIKAILQKDDSPLKTLSFQRLKKTEEIHILNRYSQINILFLVHLSLPIRTTDQIPLLQQALEFPLRNQYDVNKTYFCHYGQFANEVKKILKSWFFKEQMQEPSLPQESWTKEVKSKKFAHVDFKLNQKLKMMGIKPSSTLETRQQGVKFKESLQEKIARKIKELPLEKDWYQKMIKQIKRDHKNKLLQVRSMIRVRGQNKITRPSVSQARKVYSSFYEQINI